MLYVYDLGVGGMAVVEATDHGDGLEQMKRRMLLGRGPLRVPESALCEGTLVVVHGRAGTSCTVERIGDLPRVRPIGELTGGGLAMSEDEVEEYFPGAFGALGGILAAIEVATLAGQRTLRCDTGELEAWITVRPGRRVGFVWRAGGWVWSG